MPSCWWNKEAKNRTKPEIKGVRTSDIMSLWDKMHWALQTFKRSAALINCNFCHIPKNKTEKWRDWKTAKMKIKVTKMNAKLRFLVGCKLWSSEIKNKTRYHTDWFKNWNSLLQIEKEEKKLTFGWRKRWERPRSGFWEEWQWTRRPGLFLFF